MPLSDAPPPADADPQDPQDPRDPRDPRDPQAAQPPLTLLRLLGRGAVAGAMAGAVTAGFSLLLAEPIIDRAILLANENAVASFMAATPRGTGAVLGTGAGSRTGTSGHLGEHLHLAERGHAHEHAEMFSRTVQHGGLVVSTIATGIALGVLFAVIYALIHRRDPGERPWERSLWLAGAALTGVWLLPFLRYPADPPGAGEPGDLGALTMTWLGAMVIGIGTVALAWRLASSMRTAIAPLRQAVVAAVLISGTGVLFLLPADPDAVNTPPELLWDFRLVSAASAILLWTALGATFGLLGLRNQRA